DARHRGRRIRGDHRLRLVAARRLYRRRARGRPLTRNYSISSGILNLSVVRSPERVRSRRQDRARRVTGGTGMAAQQLSTRCCVVGGGPCGLMLGYLLARAGVDVVVLEKHADFLRDFRGDTIHPSTLQLMHELGLLDDFLKLPHTKATTIGAWFGDKEYPFADFTHLPTRAKFVALMPQWDFLNFLADRGRRYPAFHLHTRTEAIDLIK